MEAEAGVRSSKAGPAGDRPGDARSHRKREKWKDSDGAGPTDVGLPTVRLGASAFLLLSVTRFVVICQGGPGKRVQVFCVGS